MRRAIRNQGISRNNVVSANVSCQRFRSLNYRPASSPWWMAAVEYFEIERKANIYGKSIQPAPRSTIPQRYLLQVTILLNLYRRHCSRWVGRLLIDVLFVYLLPSEIIKNEKLNLIWGEFWREHILFIRFFPFRQSFLKFPFFHCVRSSARIWAIEH